MNTGILLNSEMADFSAPGYPKPVRPANFIKPGKRPQSSKNPSILVDVKNETPFMALGSGQGGPEMITTVVQVDKLLTDFILNLIGFGFSYFWLNGYDGFFKIYFRLLFETCGSVRTSNSQSMT